ncbi:MAG TPA: hypothetical protein VFN74_00350, partial [Chloroflexota bacterium]|nr:hypothetical protein [Chloroflexota bacterium]
MPGSQQLRAEFSFLRDVVAEMERTVPYASALVKSEDGVRISLRDGEQSASRAEPRTGVVFTVSNGSYLEEEATGDTSEEAVRAAAARLVERAAARPKSNGKLNIDPGEPLDRTFETETVDDPSKLSLAQKLERFEALRQRVRTLDPRAVQATLRFTDGNDSKLFVNRAKFVSEDIWRIQVFVTLFVSNGTDR